MNRISLHGFTSMELLVTLGVLAILAVFIYPMFAKVRDDCPPPSCLNNQRQLTIAVSIAASDSDDCLPLPQSWVETVKIDCNCLRCPQQKKRAALPQVDYGYNGRLYTLVDGKVSPLHTAVLTHPETIEVSCDVMRPYAAPAGTTDPGLLAQDGKYTVSAFSREAALNRHKEGVVISYLDTHIAVLKAGEYGHGTNPYSIPLVEK